MSGLSIVSGIALSMGQPASMPVESSMVTLQTNSSIGVGQTSEETKTQVAGLSQWFWQLVAPPKGEKYDRIEIDRPYRF
jgi:hypothetical protein